MRNDPCPTCGVRLATRSEIEKALSHMDREANWEYVISFARSVYGARVYKAKLSFNRSDDYESRLYLDWISAYDQDGNLLPFDMQASFWQSGGYHGKIWSEYAEEEIQDRIARAIRKQTNVKRSLRKPGYDHLTPMQESEIRDEVLHQIVYSHRPELDGEIDDIDTFYVDRKPDYRENGRYFMLYVREERAS